MPIKGLSDRGLAFPEIGQIRKGAKKGENRPGQDLTYFRVEFAEGEEKTAAKFRAIYKDQPNAMRVLLPFNEISRVWNPWKEAYTAGRLVARSDGEFIAYQLDNQGEIVVNNWLDKSRNKVPYPADGIAGYDYQNKPVKFKNSGRLKVILPELERAAYLTLMTTSAHDIGNLSDQLAGFKELNHGQLAGIPFILRRRPKLISMPKSDTDPTRVRRKKWLVSIEVDPEWAKAKFGELNKLALPDFDGNLLGAGDIQEEVIDTDFDEDETTDFEPVSEDVPQDVELINPLSKWAVEYAAKEWNIEKPEAAKAIATKQWSNPIDKRDFMELVSA